ncbi:MAG: GTPase domain-containing protein [Propionicimonas sp.]
MGEQRARALTGLRDALAGVRLPLALPGSETAAARAREAVAQLDDYVLPRLGRLEAPLLAVVGGSTGAGKSTLVNSVIGRVVTTPGVIRPTTRSPVLVHHPDDAAWFTADRILPGLGRSADRVADAKTLQLVPEPTLPPGLAILDAPDVDSVVAENRALAAQLLAAADLWLFVTSAARYADAVPWDYLRSAAARDAVVAVVLDRVPPAAMSEVPVHLGQMMGQRGLGSSPLFAVPETQVDDDGLLPDSAVAPIRGWLGELAQDAASRRAVVLQTLDGAIRALVAAAPQIAQAVTDQANAVHTLRQDAEQSYAEAVRTVAVQTADGSMLRGEVLERWHDFVGTGEFFRAVEQKIGWLRDRMMAAFRGEPKQAAEVSQAVESGMEVLIREAGEAAAERAASAWQAHPAGRELLARAGSDLTRASQEFETAAKQLVRDWQSDVMELVSEVGAAKKSQARFWALGVNGVGVALMILVFSQTGGLVGAELGVAGGTAVLAQRVLEAVFGEDAVRRLAKQAKQQLDDRVEALLAGELARYETALAAVDVRPEQADAIAAAVAEIEAEPASAEPEPEHEARPELPRPAPAPLPLEAAGPVLEGTVIIDQEQP